MNRLIHILIICTVLVVGARQSLVAQDAADQQQRLEGPAISLEQEVTRLSVLHSGEQALWPGFDPLAVPLAVYDGEQTFLFRHSSPPKGFLPISNQLPAIYVWNGRYEAVTANTSAEIGGVATATVLLDKPQTNRPLLDTAAIAIHEAFHVYQRKHHPDWVGNEADLFTYPIESAQLLALRRLETEALRRSLAAKIKHDTACWARKAIALREVRYARMDAAYSAYERGTELNEGLATYVEMRAASRPDVDLPAAEFGPAEVRRRAYASGSALALLLDQFMPSWSAKFESGNAQSLDVSLSTALGPGNECVFDESFVTQTEQTALADVIAMQVEQTRLLENFEKKPGWRVVIDAGQGEPLWPQGFDPLNVMRMGPISVLHTRFLRLGNGGGQLEVLNAEALSEGVGPHPLFQGVRRMVLTGLNEPEVSNKNGSVTIRAQGLIAEFKKASVARDGKIIIVRLE